MNFELLLVIFGWAAFAIALIRIVTTFIAYMNMSAHDRFYVEDINLNAELLTIFITTVAGGVYYFGS